MPFFSHLTRLGGEKKEGAVCEVANLAETVALCGWNESLEAYAVDHGIFDPRHVLRRLLSSGRAADIKRSS